MKKLSLIIICVFFSHYNIVIAAKMYCPKGASLKRTADRLLQFCEKDGKRHGPFIHKYPSGKVHLFSHYKNGKQDGPFMKKHKNGKIAELSYFFNGELTGISRLYRKDGSLISATNWNKNPGKKMHDFHFYENGTISTIVSFHIHPKTKEQVMLDKVEYNRNGTAKVVTSYRNGQFKNYKVYYYKGKKKQTLDAIWTANGEGRTLAYAQPKRSKKNLQMKIVRAPKISAKNFQVNAKDFFQMKNASMTAKTRYKNRRPAGRFIYN